MNGWYIGKYCQKILGSQCCLIWTSCRSGNIHSTTMHVISPIIQSKEGQIDFIFMISLWKSETLFQLLFRWGGTCIHVFEILSLVIQCKIKTPILFLKVYLNNVILKRKKNGWSIECGISVFKIVLHVNRSGQRPDQQMKIEGILNYK